MSKVSNFFNEVRSEMRETTWPSSTEMRKSTSSVVSIIILFAIFFFITESIMTWVLSFI